MVTGALNLTDVPSRLAPRPPWEGPARASGVDSAIAAILTATIGMRIELGYGLSVGFLMTLVLLPLWAGPALQSRQHRVVLVLAALSAVAGVVLTLAAPHTTATSTSVMISRTTLVLALAASAGALIWAGILLTPGRMAIAFGVGCIIGIPFNAGTQDNVWRFTYSLAITVFALSLADHSGRLSVQLISLLSLSGIGLLNDSRSNSSFLLLAAVMLVGQRLAALGPALSRRRRVIATMIFGTFAGFALYQAVVGAILDGAFGEFTQQRTLAQIDAGRSLLLGGRPEIAASTALILRHPHGMGSGTIAPWEDIFAAKQAMWGIGYDPNNGYVTRYMFGGGIEVHSLAGDFWIWFGLAGLALALTLVYVILRGIVLSYSRSTMTALLAYLTIRFVWDFAFSPASSAMRFLPFVLALAILGSRSLDAKPSATSGRRAS